MLPCFCASHLAVFWSVPLCLVVLFFNLCHLIRHNFASLLLILLFPNLCHSLGHYLASLPLLLLSSNLCLCASPRCFLLYAICPDTTMLLYLLFCCLLFYAPPNLCLCASYFAVSCPMPFTQTLPYLSHFRFFRFLIYATPNLCLCASSLCLLIYATLSDTTLTLCLISFCFLIYANHQQTTFPLCLISLSTLYFSLNTSYWHTCIPKTTISIYWCLVYVCVLRGIVCMGRIKAGWRFIKECVG